MSWLIGLILALAATVASAERLTTFAWDAGTDWPSGTSVELCGNGNVCQTGITDTWATLNLPVQPGDVIQGQARAVAPAGYQCGNPLVPCPYSEWATVAQTLPELPVNVAATYVAQWTGQDIGLVGLAGSDSNTNGVFTVLGSGADIWNTADGFRFVYQTLTGDSTITAQVASITNTHSWAKAGVMIRESLAANARHATVMVTPGHGVRFQRRVTTGGTSADTAGASAAAPYWVKLARAGNTFTAYQSADGSTWTVIGSATITMTASVYIGLAVTSTDNSTLNMAVFDNIIEE